MQEAVDLVIDPEISELIRPLTLDEEQLLEQSVVKEGVRDAILYAVIDGRCVVLDGHHRLRIAKKYNISFKAEPVTTVTSIEEAKAYVLLRQLARRNLTDQERAYYRGKLYGMLRHDRSGRPDSMVDDKPSQPGLLSIQKLVEKHVNEEGTKYAVAKISSVSSRTVARDVSFTKAVDGLLSFVEGGDKRNLRRLLLSGRIGGRKEIVRFAENALKRPQPVTSDVVKRLAKGEIRTVKQALSTLNVSGTRGEVGDEGPQLIVEDFRNVEIPRETVKLILTDPPYGLEYIGLWRALAEKAAEWLAPGGFLIAYSGQSHLPKIFEAMSVDGLKYFWTFAIVFGTASDRGWSRRSNYLHQRDVYNAWKPVIVYSKGDSLPIQPIDDVIFGGGYEKDFHKWQQPISEAERLIMHFTRPGDTVLDPMMGSGTTVLAAHRLGRRAIGIDMDWKAVSMVRARLSGGGGK